MKYINYLSLCCMAWMMFACQEKESLQQSGKTGFLISLTDGTQASASRTAPGELKEILDIQPADFDLTITDSSTGDPVYEDKVTEGVIPVMSGVYNLTAAYGDNPVLALDAPYFKGEVKDAVVRGGETTSVEIPCKVANSLLSVTFDNSKESFEDIYSDYSVEVKTEGAESVFLEKDGKESAYFRAGSEIEVFFHGMLKGSGEEKGIALDLSGIEELPLQAGDHLKLTLMPELDKYDIPLSIQVEVTHVTLEDTIPMEWLPKPRVSAEGFDENNTLTFAETEAKQARLHLGLSSALQEMKLKFNFEDAQFASLNGKEYLLSDAEDKAAVEEALGIALPEIGATEAGIDLSGVVSRMQTHAGATVNNTIEVDVMANDRWSSEDESVNRVYKLVCNKPVFRIDAYPGNIWTKEFTVNALREEQVESGNFSAISESITYQYSTDQSEWFALSDGMRQDKLTPGTTYYIRGLYRDVVPGEVAEIATYPEISLENGDMEDWSYEITDDSRIVLTENVDYIYWKKWFPWPSTSKESIWNTVNQTTTQDGNSPDVQWYPFVGTVSNPPYVGCCYVANSGTIPVEGNEAHKGKSALLRTVGWGSGNTAGGGSSIIKNVTPGELYLGSYDLSSHQPVYGIDYHSRPTAVKFWCKYVPKSTDLMIAQIVVMDENGETIGAANISEKEAGSTDWIERTLNIHYTNPLQEPHKMYISFKSGTLVDTGVMDKPEFGNLSDGESVGSKLYVDDVELVYEK